MKTTIIFSLLSIPLLVQGQMIAPQLVASGGGVSNEMEWSVGETVISTYAVSGFMLTQGFHQSNITVVPVDVFEIPEFDVQVYPNPVMNTLFISLSELPNEALEMEFYDLNGKTILRSKLNAVSAEIDASTWASGVYLLRIKMTDNVVKTWKVIKQN